MSIDKKTAIILTASTAIGYLGDVLTYSLSESKGKPFKLMFPKGMEALKLLGLGIVSGVVIDYAVKKIENLVTSPEEKELQKLFDLEKEKLAAGLRAKQTPVAIIWNNVA